MVLVDPPGPLPMEGHNKNNRAQKSQAADPLYAARRIAVSKGKCIQKQKRNFYGGAQAWPALGQGREAGRWNYCFINSSKRKIPVATPRFSPLCQELGLGVGRASGF